MPVENKTAVFLGCSQNSGKPSYDSRAKHARESYRKSFPNICRQLKFRICGRNIRKLGATNQTYLVTQSFDSGIPFFLEIEIAGIILAPAEIEGGAVQFCGTLDQLPPQKIVGS